MAPRELIVTMTSLPCETCPVDIQEGELAYRYPDGRTGWEYVHEHCPEDLGGASAATIPYTPVPEDDRALALV